ncbi:MAG: TolC family protein [Chitinophagaceae bacterium]|nr:MAG: TolC family protein [Chitinophagaceae bacterium]
MKHSILACLAATLIITGAQAQERKKLSLHEAITLGLQHSKQLKNSQAKVVEAVAAVQEARERKLPNASVTGSYLRLSSANIDMKNKSTSNPPPAEPSSPAASQAMYGILNVSQPLYTGGKIKYAIKSAEYLEKAARLDAEYDEGEIVQNTLEAFSNLFKANTAVRLVNENLAQNKLRVKDLENLEKNGLLARNDLLKAQLQESTVELNLLDAQNNLQVANLNMNIMLGLPDNTLLELDTAGIERKADDRTLEDYVQAALSGRRDRQAIGYRVKAAESGLKTIAAEKMPALSITGGYVAANIPNVISISNAVNVGLGISYNISSLWKTKSKLQQASARVQQLAITESIVDDKLKLEVSSNYMKLLSLRKKIEVYAKAKEQAAENLRIVKNKFDNQLATTTDLLEADVANLQAGLAFTMARADAFVAYNQLLQSSGLLTAAVSK